MNLPAFIQSFTEKEKQELFLLLKMEFSPNEPETVREFFQRHLHNGRLSARLITSFGDAISQERNHPETSCLNKAAKDVTFDDLYRWRGMGKKTWQAFVALRGY